MNFGRLTVPQRISAVAMLVVALAAFLPWVSIFGISKRGIEGDGVITLVLALAGVVILALTSGLVASSRAPGRVSQIALLVLAVLVAFVGLFDMNGAAAIGLYLTLFGGIAWVVGAVWQLIASKQTPTSVTDPDSGAISASQPDPSTAMRPTNPGGPPTVASSVEARSLPQPSSLPSADWYPQPDGSVRYWDGQTWTDHIAWPTSGPPA